MQPYTEVESVPVQVLLKMDGSVDFSIQLKCFQLIGLKRQSAKNFYFIPVFSIICIPFWMFSHIFYAVQNFENVLLLAEVAGPNFTDIIGASKLITFYVAKEKFYSMVDDIKKLSLQGKFQTYQVSNDLKFISFFN